MWAVVPRERGARSDGRGVYAHASTTDSLYHVQLRYELTRRLGVSWDPPDRGRADISGIGPHVRREFSRRAAEIAAHMAEREVSSGRARTVAGFVTRAEKDPLLGADDLRPKWKDRARAVGFGPLRLEAVVDRAPRRSARDLDAPGDGETGAPPRWPTPSPICTAVSPGATWCGRGVAAPTRELRRTRSRSRPTACSRSGAPSPATGANVRVRVWPSAGTRWSRRRSGETQESIAAGPRSNAPSCPVSWPTVASGSTGRPNGGRTG